MPCTALRRARGPPRRGRRRAPRGRGRARSAVGATVVIRRPAEERLGALIVEAEPRQRSVGIEPAPPATPRERERIGGDPLVERVDGVALGEPPRVGAGLFGLLPRAARGRLACLLLREVALLVLPARAARARSVAWGLRPPRRRDRLRHEHRLGEILVDRLADIVWEGHARGDGPP